MRSNWFSLKYLVLILFFNTLVIALSISCTSVVEASEVTSPFGWRIHPIFGTSIFHSGVDIAGDFGDGIPADEGGVVSIVYGHPGYGNYIDITHPDGNVTRYAHCQGFTVQDGTTVTAGQIVALVGSTGYSTGPHVHVEYRIDGVPVDPLPRLQSLGWDLSYDGNPDVIQGDVPNSDWDGVPWNFGDFNDVGGKLREIMDLLSDTCVKGLDLLKDEVFTLFQFLVLIDIAFFGILLAMGKGNWQEDIAKKFMKYGFLLFILLSWKMFVNDMVLDSMVNIGTMASSGDITAISENISNPSKIVSKGAQLTAPIFNYIASFKGIAILFNAVNIIIAVLLAIGIFGSFIAIGILFFVRYLNFYIIALFAFILTPTVLNKHIKYIGEHGIGGVIASGIQLMVLTMLLGVMLRIIESFGTTAYDHIAYFKIFINCLGMCLLSTGITQRIGEMLGSKPKF